MFFENTFSRILHSLHGGRRLPYTMYTFSLIYLLYLLLYKKLLGTPRPNHYTDKHRLCCIRFKFNVDTCLERQLLYDSKVSAHCSSESSSIVKDQENALKKVEKYGLYLHKLNDELLNNAFYLRFFVIR